MTTMNEPPTGRCYQAYVTGTNDDDLRQKAMREATKYFGPDLKLWLPLTYTASAVTAPNWTMAAQFEAMIPVFEVLEADQ
ncbi:hypothetical protein [Nonomuraea sp. NPDC049141]|uniref:hypothetical protein n=1 Tax=Nonomuraea sp. NPDC049141 TaxID=3155500 RepID=UPI00340B8B32